MRLPLRMKDSALFVLKFGLVEGEDSSVLLEKLRHAVSDIVPGRKVLGADCAKFRLRALLSGEWGGGGWRDVGYVFRTLYLSY